MFTNINFTNQKSSENILLFKSRSILFAFSLIALLFSSCKKDPSLTIDDEILEIEGAAQQHSDVAKVLSLMVTSSDFMDLVYREVKVSPVAEYNSIPMLKLLQGNNGKIFKSEFEKALVTIQDVTLNFEDFMNDYIRVNPGLSLSFPDESMVKNRSNEIYVFSESLHDELAAESGYYFVLDGNVILKSVSETGPNFEVLVIQNLEGYVVLDRNLMDDASYFDNNSRVRYCSNLTSILPALNFNEKLDDLEISIDGQTFVNPFRNMLFITNSEINKAYHNSCIEDQKYTQTNSIFRNPPTDCGGGTQPVRDTWNSSVTDEHSLQMRLPNGNNFLEQGRDWCAWWNKNCRFQIDLYLPTKFNSTTYSPIQLTYFAYYDEDDIKTKGFTSPESELRFTRWFFDSGNHGDEWRYRWTGKHRKGGVEETNSIGNMLGSTVGFKDSTGLTAGLSQSMSATFTSKYTYRDQLAGSALTYYCDNIFENQHGKVYYASEVQFRLKERP